MDYKTYLTKYREESRHFWHNVARDGKMVLCEKVPPEDWCCVWYATTVGNVRINFGNGGKQIMMKTEFPTEKSAEVLEKLVEELNLGVKRIDDKPRSIGSKFHPGKTIDLVMACNQDNHRTIVEYLSRIRKIDPLALPVYK
jgi:hypothetical protein